MSAMNVNAVPGVEKFTDELLAKNFIAIAQGFDSMDNRLDMLDNWIRHVEGHVGELYELAKKAAEVQVKVKTTSRVKPFIIGAVVGAAVYTYATRNSRKIETLVEKANEEARRRFGGDDTIEGEVANHEGRNNSPRA